VIEESEFDSIIKPIADDAKAVKEGFGPIEDEALKINGHTREELAKGPELKIVWGQFQEYLKKYNLKGKTGGKWDSPIPAGFNNRNFDDVIIKRLCDKFGPKPDDFGGWGIFHPMYNFDLFQEIQTKFFFTSFNGSQSMSFDTLREYFGYKKEGAHNSLIDCIQGADLLIRILRLNKSVINGDLLVCPECDYKKKIKFENCVGGKI